MLICVNKTKGQHMGCFCRREVRITHTSGSKCPQHFQVVLPWEEPSGRSWGTSMRSWPADRHICVGVTVSSESLTSACLGTREGCEKGLRCGWHVMKVISCGTHCLPTRAVRTSFPCAAPSSALRQWLLNLGRGFLPPKAVSPSISGHFCYAVCPTLVWKQLSIH